MNQVWQAGGNILDENNNVVINSEETANALNFIKSLFDDGYIQKSNITGGGFEFASGKVGIELEVEPSKVTQVANANPDLNFKVGPILTGEKKIGYVTVGSYAMFSKAENREATIAWIKFLTNKENTQSILAASGFMSPRKDISAADYMTDDRLVFMSTQSEWATGTGPMNSHYSEILEVQMCIRDRYASARRAAFTARRQSTPSGMASMSRWKNRCAWSFHRPTSWRGSPVKTAVRCALFHSCAFRPPCGP